MPPLVTSEPRYGDTTGEQMKFLRFSGPPGTKRVLKKQKVG